VADLRKLISDLYHNRSKKMTGMGYIYAGSADEVSTLSGAYRIEQGATYVTLDIDKGHPDQPVTVVRAAKHTANAIVLSFQEDMSILATATRTHRIVVGGGYSGCVYSVYNSGGGEFKCVHTARPFDNVRGVAHDDCVTALRAYAADKRWTLVHEIPTRGDGISGPGINGCVTTAFATRISYNSGVTPIVRTDHAPDREARLDARHARHARQRSLCMRS
jgi:hypothetical protein